MEQDRRKYSRYAAAMTDGEFQVMRDGTAGLVSVNDFSRTGFRAVLNRPVNLQDELECELRFPDSIMTFTVRGRVMWVRPREQSATVSYAAGVAIAQIDSFARERMVDYCWRQQENGRPVDTVAPLDL